MFESSRPGVTSRIVVHVRTTAILLQSTLLDSSRCHRHGGCHSRCHGGRSVFLMAVSMTFMVVVIVVTAASLQGHGCQGSKEKCSLSAGSYLKELQETLRRRACLFRNQQLCHSNFKDSFPAKPQKMMATSKHLCLYSKLIN